MKKFTVGIDVGGTNIKFGLVNAAGRIIARSRLSTQDFKHHKDALINAIVKTIRALLTDNQISLRDVEGVGMGLPGPIDAVKGEVKYLPNIPGWNNVPLAKKLQSQLKVPVFIDNDVNVIALGEWIYGAGRGCNDLVCMTLGTGVGGGLILDGKLYRGAGHLAGEIGYMLLKDEYAFKPFDDGNSYLEYYVGHGHLSRKAEKVFHQKNMTSVELNALAKKGNRKAILFWERVGKQIGNVLVGVVNLLNPKMIIIGGGVANNYNFIAPSIKSTIKERAMKVHGQMVKVVRAQLGDDAGVLGAQILVREGLKH